MDSGVDPCQNFYQFACGKFVNETIIPRDVDGISTLNMLQYKIDEQLISTFSDEIKEDDLSIIKIMKSFHEMCRNESDTVGLKMKIFEDNLRKILKNQGGCPILKNTPWNEAHFDWVKSVYQSHKMGYSTNRFVNTSVRMDPHNHTKHILFIERKLGVLTFVDGPNTQINKDHLNQLLDTLVRLGAERRQAEEEIKDTVDFEIQLTKDERPNQLKSSRRMAMHELDTNYDGTSWADYLNGILAPYAHLDRNDEVIISDTNILKTIPRLLARTPKRVVANYFCLQIIWESLYHLGKTPRPVDSCVDIIYQFSVVFGALYVKHYIHKDTKDKVTHLTNNLRNTLHSLINQATWIDDYSKFSALDKLRTIEALIGYPDELRNDDKINELFKDIYFDPENFVASAVSLANHEEKLALSELKKPLDSWIRHSSVDRVEAEYIEDEHLIDVPAGLLRGHFYNASRPNYMNYGAVGSIIGREMTYAASNYRLVEFYDLRSEVQEVYKEKIKCFIEQYGNYVAKQVNQKIDGSNTLVENIAGNVGLKAAYFAYKKWAKENGKEPRLPGLQKYKPKQMFWISFANTLCEKFRTEALEQLIADNTYLPPEFRVIGSVSNMHHFAKDFKCPSGSPMNPANKCSMW